MKYWRNKLKNLGEEEINWLLATFVATLFGVMGSELFRQVGHSVMAVDGFVAQFLISLGAVLAYVAAAGGVFYVLLPESRPAFQRIWQRVWRK